MHDENSNPNTDSNDTTQEYERYFPELDLSPEEDDFLHDIMIQRMELHDHNKRLAGGDAIAKARERLVKEEDFEALLKRLPHEDSLIVNRHEADLNDEHADVCDFYYKVGFLDGLKVSRFVMGIH